VARSILAVTSQLPWPLNTGGHLRTFHMLRGLSEHFRVRLVAAADGHRTDAAQALRDHGIDVKPVVVAPRTTMREALRAAAAAAARRPYVMYRRHYWPAVAAEIVRQSRLEAAGLLYLDHLDSYSYRQLLPSVRAVLDLHNVYSTIAARAADEHPSKLARLYLRREARLLRRSERDAVRGCDGVLAVSDEEARVYRDLGARAVTLAPNGVDCSAYADLPTGRTHASPTLLYVGPMSWAPNAAAVTFLAREVMPRLRSVIPEARLRIIGRDMTSDVLALANNEGVEVLGMVPSMPPHLVDASVLAVPLETGGGTRLKILEAFAAGLPVVSTAVGCEGLRVVDREHLVVAERVWFAEALIAALRDPAAGAERAARARALTRERYDWRTVGATACASIERLWTTGPAIACS
jgi:glycosyltransferase involved in cell wall biosynthesis